MLYNGLIYFLGSFGSKLLTFLLLPLYTTLLTREDYGRVDLIITCLFFVEAIFTLKLPDAIYRFMISDKNKKSSLISSLLFFNKNCLIVFFIFFNIIFLFFRNGNYFVLLFYFGTGISLPFYKQLLRGLKEGKVYSLLGAMESLIFLVSNIVLLYHYKLGYQSILISRIISSTFSIFFIFIKFNLWNFVNEKREKKMMKEMMIYSVPLIPSAISWWIMKFSDRVSITHFIGLDSNGIYAISSKFPALLMLINSIFYMVWKDSSIEEYNSLDKNEYYSKVFKYYYKVLFSISMIFIVSSEKMIKFFARNSYSEAWKYSLFLYLGTVFWGFSGFYATGYLSSKKTTGTFYSSLIGAITNILINIIFIKKYGLQVASFSTFACFFVMWIIRKHDTKKYFIIKYNKIEFYFLVLLNILLILFNLFFQVKFVLFQFIFVLIISCVLNKEILIMILKRGKRWLQLKRVL